VTYYGECYSTELRCYGARTPCVCCRISLRTDDITAQKDVSDAATKADRQLHNETERNKESLKKAQQDKIENVAGSV
jgi:hypothetical protein